MGRGRRRQKLSARIGTGRRWRRPRRPAFSRTRPAPTCCSALREALTMLLDEEGCRPVFARHARHGEATRRRRDRLGPRICLCADPREYSNSLTAVSGCRNGCDADRLARNHPRRLRLSLGTGPRQGQGKVFRIGHLGHFNDFDAVRHAVRASEMGLRRAAIPYRPAGSPRRSTSSEPG